MRNWWGWFFLSPPNITRNKKIARKHFEINLHWRRHCDNHAIHQVNGRRNWSHWNTMQISEVKMTRKEIERCSWDLRSWFGPKHCKKRSHVFTYIMTARLAPLVCVSGTIVNGSSKLVLRDDDNCGICSNPFPFNLPRTCNNTSLKDRSLPVSWWSAYVTFNNDDVNAPPARPAGSGNWKDATFETNSSDNT